MAEASGLVGGAVLGGVSWLVQRNQQKIAEQKQKDALAKAEADQANVLNEQQKAEDDKKRKEKAATQQAFARSSAARSGGATALPGAVTADQAIGSVGTPNTYGKKLIGS